MKVKIKYEQTIPTAQFANIKPCIELECDETEISKYMELCRNEMRKEWDAVKNGKSSIEDLDFGSGKKIKEIKELT